MFTSYTDRMEAALFEQWDNFDDYADDYSSLIETLNSEHTFRSFGDGLLFFMQKKTPELTAETAVKHIEKLCIESGVPKETIACTNALKNWFNGGPRPKKGEDSRESMFALAFALKLSPQETSELFHKVYLDRAFDFRNEKEIIYYFCLLHNKTWADTIRLVGNLKSNKSCEDLTVYTSNIFLDLQSITEEAALLSYIDKHGNNLSKKSITAKEILEELKTEAADLIEKETALEAMRSEAGSISDMYEDHLDLQVFRNTNARSLNHIYEVITGCLVRGNNGTKTLFKNARLPKEIKNRFPEAATLSKKDPTYEEIRKLLILLFSYKFWLNAQCENDLIELDIYIDNLNAVLNDCGFSLIYYGNPYDWLFLYCTLSNKPIETFRSILADVLQLD